MKTNYFIILLMLSACSTFLPKPEELKARPNCVVWKEGPLGARHIVEPEESLLAVPRSCFLLNMYMCKYTNYTYSGDKDVVIKIEGKEVASLNDRRMTVPSDVSKIEPFNLGKNSAEYAMQGPFGPKQNMKIEYNDQCSLKQAALGVVALLAK